MIAASTDSMESRLREAATRSSTCGWAFVVVDWGDRYNDRARLMRRLVLCLVLRIVLYLFQAACVES